MGAPIEERESVAFENSYVRMALGRLPSQTQTLYRSGLR